VRTNIPFLQNLLQRPDVAADRISTNFLDEHLAELTAGTEHRRLHFGAAVPAAPGRAGARVDTIDPLAVLDYGRSGGAAAAPALPEVIERPGNYDLAGPEGTIAVRAPMQATVVSVDVSEGERVRRGQQLLILNAMKMEHVIQAPAPGIVRQIVVSAGDTLYEDEPLLFFEEREAAEGEEDESNQLNLDVIRADLAEVERRRALTLDESREEAVARRHQRGGRTARENVADLLDPDTFIEYGQLALAQGLRGTTDEILNYAPADGMVMGLGHVNGELFDHDEERTRCVVLAYDYTVLAGTQGGMNHRKQDRMLDVAAHLRAPVFYFCEGGGGRAGGGSRNAAGAGSGSERMAAAAGWPHPPGTSSAG